jgi:hypothetical protein
MKNLILLLGIITVAISSCKKENANPALKIYKVKYTMICTDCQVIYVSDTLGTQSSAYHQNSSWSYTFNAKENQQLLFLAYNQSANPQAVTATISLNDSVLSTQTTYCPFNGSAFCVDTAR